MEGLFLKADVIWKVTNEKGLDMERNTEWEASVSHKAESLGTPKDRVRKSSLASQLSRALERNKTEDKKYLIPDLPKASPGGIVHRHTSNEIRVV